VARARALVRATTMLERRLTKLVYVKVSSLLDQHESGRVGGPP